MVLTGLTAIALTIRLWWVLVADRKGFGFNDSYFYDHSARMMLRGFGYVGLDMYSTARWPPGYSTLLAGLYWVFGEHAIVGEIFNALIGAATVPLLYVVVRRPFGSRVALVAAGMLAVMPGPILWTDLTVTETLYTFLFVLFLLLVSRSHCSWKWAAALGAYVGLVGLVRSEAPMWLAVPLVVWIAQAGFRRAVAPAAAMVAALAIVLAPWTIRNSAVMDAFVPLGLNSGETFWAGHNPQAGGTENYASEELLDSFGGTGPRRELLISRGMQQLGVDYMLDNPVRELQLVPRKLFALVRGDSYAFVWVNQGPQFAVGYGATQTWSTLADFAWFTLLGLTIVGVFTLGRRTWREPLMVAIGTTFVLILVLYGFVYYGNYRYRLPYEPAMMVVAALVVVRAWAGLRNARGLSIPPAVEAEDPPAPATWTPRRRKDDVLDPTPIDGTPTIDDLWTQP